MDSVSRGKIANTILNDEFFKTAVSDINNYLIQQWKSSSDPITREALWHRVSALDSIVSYLEIAIESGEFDAHSTTRADCLN